MRMMEERWPAINHSWISAGRRKRGRPRQPWQDGITEGGWGQKMPRIGYFGDENWEGGGPLYKLI
jgi:hypothetical protein